MSTQDLIDELIAYIDSAVARNSVSNRQVATVLDFLNTRLKSVSTDDLSELFLSKTSPDLTSFLIKFLGGVEFGSFVPGLSGTGGAVDSLGNGTLQSLTVRGALSVAEYVINRISVVGSEFYFTEGVTVDSTSQRGDGSWLIHVRKDYPTQQLDVHQGDILRGICNDLLNSGSIFSSFVRVEFVNSQNFTIVVSVYDDDDVPDGVNHFPVSNMAYRRWGHVSDPTRQSCVYISSLEKRIVFLDGVNSPILTDDENGSNYAAFFGLPFADASGTGHALYALRGVPFNPGQVYLYVRGIYAQSFHSITYNGAPVRTVRDRGEWSLSVAQSDCPYFYNNSIQDAVYHLGCKWLCLSDGTLEEPAWNSLDWALVEGLSGLSMSFESSGGSSFYAGAVNTYVTPHVYVGDNDISDDIDDGDYVWTRYSEGRQSSESDDAWNAAHVSGGRILHITNTDMPVTWSRSHRVIFTCTAALLIGGEDIDLSNSVTI